MADQSLETPTITLGSTTSPSTIMASTSETFQRRTVESARQFRESLTSVMRGIEPLVETARSVLNRTQSDVNNSEVNANNTDVVLNIGNLQVGDDSHATMDPQNVPAVSTLNNNPSNDDPENGQERNPEEQNSQQTQNINEFLTEMGKYIPFILILFFKAIYDYNKGIFVVIILFVTFAQTNSAVKTEITKRENRSVSTLFVEFFYIILCLAFVHYFFTEQLVNFNVAFDLILMKTFTHPVTVWHLLWICLITDFILKLITVLIKICIGLLPGFIIDFRNRGRFYVFIETTSQLYRSIATIQPWLYYLLECYQGAEKIVAVFLSASYIISKGGYLLCKVHTMKKSAIKLVQNVSIGSAPNKGQIMSAGEHCPICHDNYNNPVLLQCRHIFCEDCVSIWFDRERTCPLCRAKIVEDPSWRDGSTSYFLQLF